MGCSVRGGSYGGHYGGNDGCVKDTVKRILDAQQRVTDHCVSSCDTAIDDLLSPERHHRPHRYDTIPFMLYTKDCVKPFVGSGFTSWIGRDAYRRGNYRCVESPIFRVKGFKKGNDNCVILELLEPIKDKGGHGHGHGRPQLEGDTDSNTIQYRNECGCSICQVYGDHYFDNFCQTGVCITVDLSCFCGISCLDPVRVESRFD